MIIIDEPNVPYKKKKESDTSKASKKSKHKHIYDKKVIIEYRFKNLGNYLCSPYTYCSICGKLGDTLIKEITKEWNYTKEEWFKIFPDATLLSSGTKLPIFDFNNVNEV